MLSTPSIVQQPLSNIRLIAAQLAGIGGMALTTIGAFFLSEWFVEISYPLDRFFLFLLVILVTASYSWFQWLILRRWAVRGWLWTLVSTSAFLLILLVGMTVPSQAYPSVPNGFAQLDEGAKTLIRQEIEKSSAIIGAIIGVPCGLIFGVIQSQFLNQGCRRWWLFSIVPWMVFCAFMRVLSVGVLLIFAEYW